MDNSEKLSFHDPRAMDASKLDFDYVVNLQQDLETDEFVVNYKSGKTKRLPSISPPPVDNIESSKLGADGTLSVEMTDGRILDAGRVRSEFTVTPNAPSGLGVLSKDGIHKPLVSTDPNVTISEIDGVPTITVPDDSGPVPIGALDFSKAFIAETTGDASKRVTTPRVDCLAYNDTSKYLPYNEVLLNTLGIEKYNDGRLIMPPGVYFIELNATIFKASSVTIDGVNSLPTTLNSQTNQPPTDDVGTRVVRDSGIQAYTSQAVKYFQPSLWYYNTGSALATDRYAVTPKASGLEKNIAVQISIFKVADTIEELEGNKATLVPRPKLPVTDYIQGLRDNPLNFTAVGGPYGVSGAVIPEGTKEKPAIASAHTLPNGVGVVFPRYHNHISSIFSTGVSPYDNPSSNSIVGVQTMVKDGAYAALNYRIGDKEFMGGCTQDEQGNIYPAPLDYEHFLVVENPGEYSTKPRERIRAMVRTTYETFSYNSYAITAAPGKAAPFRWVLSARCLLTRTYVEIDQQDNVTFEDGETKVFELPFVENSYDWKLTVLIDSDNDPIQEVSIAALEIRMDGVNILPKMTSATVGKWSCNRYYINLFDHKPATHFTVTRTSGFQISYVNSVSSHNVMTTVGYNMFPTDFDFSELVVDPNPNGLGVSVFDGSGGYELATDTTVATIGIRHAPDHRIDTIVLDAGMEDEFSSVELLGSHKHGYFAKIGDFTKVDGKWVFGLPYSITPFLSHIRISRATSGPIFVKSIECAVESRDSFKHNGGTIKVLPIDPDTSLAKYEDCVYCPITNKVLYIPANAPEFLIYDITSKTFTKETFGLDLSEIRKFGRGVFSPLDSKIYIPSGFYGKHLIVDMSTMTVTERQPLFTAFNSGANRPSGKGAYRSSYLDHEGRVCFVPFAATAWEGIDPHSGLGFLEIWRKPLGTSDVYDTPLLGPNGKYWTNKKYGTNDVGDSATMDFIARESVFYSAPSFYVSASFMDQQGRHIYLGGSGRDGVGIRKVSGNGLKMPVNVFTKRYWMES